MLRYTKIILIIITITVNTMAEKLIYDFKKSNKLSSWSVVDDGVMGGRSAGILKLNSDGHGEFRGFISLRNYGGFSSIRCDLNSVKSNEYKFISLRVKGDDKYYQLRIKSSIYDRHVYIKKFYAKSGWQDIKIELDSMTPQFRGRRLNYKNYNGGTIDEIGILIGNKVEENFYLLIDYITLE